MQGNTTRLWRRWRHEGPGAGKPLPVGGPLRGLCPTSARDRVCPAGETWRDRGGDRRGGSFPVFRNGVRYVMECYESVTDLPGEGGR